MTLLCALTLLDRRTP